MMLCWAVEHTCLTSVIWLNLCCSFLESLMNWIKMEILLWI